MGRSPLIHRHEHELTGRDVDYGPSSVGIHSGSRPFELFNALLRNHHQ